MIVLAARTLLAPIRAGYHPARVALLGQYHRSVAVSLLQRVLAIRETGSRSRLFASGGRKPQDQVSSRTRKNSRSTRDIPSKARNGQSVWDYTSEVDWRRRTKRNSKHGSNRIDVASVVQSGRPWQAWQVWSQNSIDDMAFQIFWHSYQRVA
jgi:hypothetical protein